MQHPNARLTVFQRGLIAERVLAGWTLGEVARAAGVSRQTASKWVNRYREHGPAGLADRSSRPHVTRPRVPVRTVRRIVKARLRFSHGPHRLAWRLGLARSTVYLVLRRFGLNRLKRRSVEPTRRYEWPEPGDMVHLDIKKLGRIGQGGGKRVLGPGPGRNTKRIGWDYVHVAIDDHSRLAFAQILPDERGASVVAFTTAAVDFFASAGIGVSRILTDNGSGYCSHAFRDLLSSHGISMRKTRPYRPQTNGKAEAFVKIVTNEWAYGRAYRSTEERAEMLGPFLDYYNRSRPHGGIDGATPISRVRS